MINVAISGQNPFPFQEARLIDITLLPGYHYLVNREILNCLLTPVIENCIADNYNNHENDLQLS